MPKGVYPQSNGSLAIVDIDASKEFVYLWVHLSFAIFAIFNLKRQLKLVEMACDQIQTCLIFPLRRACFPIKICRNAQWVHFPACTEPLNKRLSSASVQGCINVF